MSLLVDYSYRPNDIDTEMMLTEVPIDTLEGNITRQFQDPFETHKMDYVSNFITKYRYTKETLEEYQLEREEEWEELKRVRNDFIDFMEGTFREYLDIELPLIDEMVEEDQDECLHFVYRFFILNIKHNFVNLILNYIEAHRDEICETLPRKKDITTIALKREIEDPNDVLIISNLNTVIDYVLTRAFTVDEFLTLCDRDEPTLERFLIESYYDEAKVVGNFLEKYFRMIKRNFKIELECSVRNQILRKYIKYL